MLSSTGQSKTNEEYPLLYYWENSEYEEYSGAESMELHLIYRGSLHSNGATKHKHAIRRIFHRQLSEYWEREPVLQYASKRTPPESMDTVKETLAQRFSICGFRFVPLISKKYEMACGLDILLLRRSAPGDLILRGGDVDNRLKTLFDALRTPRNGEEIDGQPTVGEDPFFCLLEDDSLITEISVTTDRLLTPPDPGEHEDNVVLIIHAKIKEASPMALGNIRFAK
jgi:hypothetical protein